MGWYNEFYNDIDLFCPYCGNKNVDRTIGLQTTIYENLMERYSVGDIIKEFDCSTIVIASKICEFCKEKGSYNYVNDYYMAIDNGIFKGIRAYLDDAEEMISDENWISNPVYEHDSF